MRWVTIFVEKCEVREDCWVVSGLVEEQEDQWSGEEVPFDSEEFNCESAAIAHATHRALLLDGFNVTLLVNGNEEQSLTAR